MSSPESAPPSSESNTDEVTPRSWRATIRLALAGGHRDYTSGPLSQAILLLAIPMVLETLMESLFAICDIFWVSKLGSDATAAVGLTESVLTLYYAVAIGLSIAATAMVARRIGEGKPEAAAKAGAQAIYIGVILGTLTGILCWFAAPKILGFMGASNEVVEIGSGYARVILGANTVILLLFMHNAIFRGAGDPALAMRALWIGNGINIVLDPCLIFGWGPFPEWGLTGAAVASVIGRSVAVCYQVYHLNKGTGQLRLHGPTLTPDFSIMRRLIRVSVGGIAQMIIATSSWVALMRLMATFGSSTLAGYTIAIRIIVFTILPSWGLSNAATTLVGQHLGAKLPDRAAKSVWLTGFYNMAFLGVVMISFLLFGHVFVGIFTEDEEVLATGVRCLHVFSYGYLFYGWGMVVTQAFNGAGDTMTPTWLNLIAFWVVQIPLAWFLALQMRWGPSGVIWAVVVADALLTAMAIAMFMRGRWKTRVV